jgi:hypothetical protein
VFSISWRGKGDSNVNLFPKPAEIDSTACEVKFDTGIPGPTISLTDTGTWVGDIKSSDNVPDDDTTSP